MEAIRYFTFDGREDSSDLSERPDACPFCNNNVHPEIVKAYKPREDHGGYETLEVVFKCTNSNCRHLFFAYYSTTGHRMSTTYYLNGAGRARYHKTVSFSEIIDKISPKFQEIYNQAFEAEELKLLEIAGPGYRRALEFLIKDYLIKNDKTIKKAVEQELLGGSIKRITNDEIKDCAERAAWIGNDETHYVRKHTDKDIQDLKILISMVVNWVELNERTKHYRKMPKK